jgi:aminomethyltransferase
MEENKITLLNKWHKARGASMGVFGGYEMPLWYSSAKQEHLAVLTHAGLFDTSHMASVMVAGPDGFDLLQWCFTNDMSACIGKNKHPLSPGRSVYGVFLDDQGRVVDDAIIFMMDEKTFMIVVNAGMGGIIAAHLSENRENRDVRIEDLTDNLGKLDIQGPLAARVLKKVLKDPHKVFDTLPYFSFKGRFDPASPCSHEVRLLDGTPILLSRTGYTGEFGFEIFTQPKQFVKVWELVFGAGEDAGLMACGLAARDSLRAGAVLPLSHQDIGHWPFIHTPWSFALPYNGDRTGFTKKFIGHDALLHLETHEYTYAFAGNDLRKVSLPAVVLDTKGEEIGTVLTCATDMAIGRHEGRIYSIAGKDNPKGFMAKGLSCGFVKVKKQLAPGDAVELKDRRRSISVRIEKDIRPGRTARCLIKDMI